MLIASNQFQWLEALGTSVIASILAVGIVALIQFLYSKGVSERIVNALSKHTINIAGSWVGEGESVDEETQQPYSYKDATVFSQVGDKVSGTSTFYLYKGGRLETIKRFDIEGSVRGEVFTGVYQNQSNTSAGVGSFTAIIKSDGKVLSGKSLIYNISTRDVGDWPYHMIKE